MSEPWEFWIDCGGTFTDVIGLAPDGAVHVAKLLSGPRAPIEGVERVWREAGIPADAPRPPCRIALGTTIATNALLERRGARVALVAPRGLTDVFAIGTQQRPDLFSLRIEKPAPLHALAIAAAGRIAADGTRVEPHDDAALDRALEAARAAGCTSVAAVSLHAHVDPADESRWAARARAAGFADVVASHALAPEIGLLARGETALADAYLTPLLRRHLAALAEALPGASLRFMQSSGGLTEGTRFRGPNALLSGPAGGGVATAAIARAAGAAHAIGFDMGGTSTDVSLVRDGEPERAFETEIAGLRLRAPMLRIHTVASGGGSICRFDGISLRAGPASAGADPGPLCYGLRDAAGAPRARHLTVTDCNHFLGRLPGDRFPFPLDAAPIEPALRAIQTELAAAGHARTLDAIAAGFVEVANADMVRAIERVSVERGVDPRGCVLVAFGGAAGQHVCAVARALGIRRVLLHPLAGLLSAFGIGIAERSWDGRRDGAGARLDAAGGVPDAVAGAFAALADEGRALLEREGVAPSQMRVARALDLRALGTETAIGVEEPPDGDWRRAFDAAHRARYGWSRGARAVEVARVRVRVAAPSPAAGRTAVRALLGEAAVAAPVARALRVTARDTSHAAWFPDAGRVVVPRVDRERLEVGAALDGPALILDATGTIAVDPGFRAELGPGGVLALVDRAARVSATRGAARAARDPVWLEVMGSRFMSIAEQMGATLNNTAVSVNIKERLDASCAVFDGAGGLVANAPHIPVHLGAMEETVRALRAEFPQPAPGDAWVTNDPFRGGSHLPDVTLVTPVFVDGHAAPLFYVGSRGHHADVGGRTPGSMPADSRSLVEEGVVLPPYPLVREGRFDEAWLRARLADGAWPARAPDDNVADLEAMAAANRVGVERLAALAAEIGSEAVASAMRALQASAAEKVRGVLERLVRGERRFADTLDDGTPIAVRLAWEGGRLVVDFAGTGPAVPGNANAPRAVVRAALLYVLRTLVADRMPLNGGCLAPIDLRVPPGSILDPPPGAAVVGGNVETSQRVVDVLLGALGVAAASQGTMNNVTFGDDAFGYYETIGGGAGAGPDFEGASGVHVHMTNTRITDPEVLERRHPVRLVEFALRRGSGGAGARRGGDGLVRRYVFRAPVSVSLLGERRVVAPWGLAGGEPGACGRNVVVRSDGRRETVGGHAVLALGAGDELVVETPGGGGYGLPAPEARPRLRPGA